MSKYVYLAFDKYSAVHVFAGARPAVKFAVSELLNPEEFDIGKMVQICETGMTVYPDPTNTVVRAVKVLVRK